MTNLKKLMKEFGYLSESSSDEMNIINDEVSSKLKTATNLDQVDTITFGLETDDGLIVKVYVDAKDADKFESAMAEMLGKEDNIEQALNNLSNDINIVDVIWPDDSDSDDSDSDDSDDSDEILNKKVYSKKNFYF